MSMIDAKYAGIKYAKPPMDNIESRIAIPSLLLYTASDLQGLRTRVPLQL
jgi:hypothetical protein